MSRSCGGAPRRDETLLFRGAAHLFAALVACDYTLGCARSPEVRWTTIDAPAYPSRRCLEIATRGSLHVDHVDGLVPGGIRPHT